MLLIFAFLKHDIFLFIFYFFKTNIENFCAQETSFFQCQRKKVDKTYFYFYLYIFF